MLRSRWMAKICTRFILSLHFDCFRFAQSLPRIRTYRMHWLTRIHSSFTLRAFGRPLWAFVSGHVSSEYALQEHGMHCPSAWVNQAQTMCKPNLGLLVQFTLGLHSVCVNSVQTKMHGLHGKRVWHLRLTQPVWSRLCQIWLHHVFASSPKVLGPARQVWTSCFSRTWFWVNRCIWPSCTGLSIGQDPPNRLKRGSTSVNQGVLNLEEFRTHTKFV
jgi:hypothetical protein